MIVLKGGAEPKALSQTMPQSVDLPVNQPGGRLHLLGGVGGWAWPATQAQEPALSITIHYRGGASEKIELINGIDLADHLRPVEVPGSIRTSLVSKGQLRYLYRDLKHPGQIIDRITLASSGKSVAPMVAAVTIESPDSAGRLMTAPLSGGPLVPANSGQAQ